MFESRISVANFRGPRFALLPSVGTWLVVKEAGCRTGVASKNPRNSHQKRLGDFGGMLKRSHVCTKGLVWSFVS